MITFLKKEKKLIIISVLVAIFWLMMDAKIAQATDDVLGGIFGTGSILTKAVGWAAAAIGYVLGFITSFVFWLAGLLVTWALNINDYLLSKDNAILYTGWKIVLGFANLGFVLAIIIIAFATIFRVESYQMKKILWKLVVAALLVNFSLVIAGAFINISDIFSKWLLARAKLDGPGDFSLKLADTLGVQSFLKTKESSNKADVVIKSMNDFGGALLTFIASIFFTAFFTLLGGLILLVIAVMLIIRYVALGILLILSPIVWLLWIFPDTVKYWQQWWSKFLRWTFFAPIVLFFLYLVVQTSADVKKYANQFSSSSNVTTELGKEGFTFGVDNILNLIIMLGLMMGGLIAANSLSLEGARQVVGTAQKAGRAFGGYVGRKGLQFGTGWLRKPRGEEGKEKSYAERIAEWSAKSKLTKIPVVGAVPGLAVRGIARLSVAGGEDLVKKAKEAAAKRSLNENIAMLGYADAPNRQGILQHLQEKDLLGKVPNILKYLDEKYKNEFARFGQGRAYSAIEKSLGMNIAMKEALERRDAVGFQREAEKFLSKLSDKDRNKLPYDAIFGEKPVFGLDRESVEFLSDNLTKSILEVNPGDVRKILVNVTPQNFERAHSAITRANSEIREVNPEKADKILLALKKTLFKHYTGAEEEVSKEEEKRIIT